VKVFFVPQSDALPLTEEVKEAVHQAYGFCKERLKANQQPVSGLSDTQLLDHELLAGLLQANRPFSKTDRLFHQMGITPKHVLRFIHQCRRGLGLNSIPGGQENTLVRGAKSRNGQAQKPSSKKLDVPELLIGLCQSQDNLVKNTCQEFNLNTAKIESAFNALKVGRFVGVPKNALYSLLFLGRELLEVIVVVVISLIVIKEGIGELRLIPSESMVPTLQVGDRLVIEKVTHWLGRDYQPGDILVFYPPEPDATIKNDPISWFMRSTGFSSLFHNTVEDPIDKAFIKRLVATEGQIVWVVPGDGVYIDGKRRDEPFVNEIALTCGDFCFPRTVPKGHMFMMGDNRNQSKDSRYFGFQPKSRVVGRAVYRILPLDRIGPLDETSDS